MSLQFLNLDDTTRGFMTEELDRDVQSGNLYLSPRLTEPGRAEYGRLLREAVAGHDADWLARQLRARSLLNAMEPRTRNGKTSMVRVPVTAPDTLAEGEFNRFYIRGLCRRAVAEGIPQLIVYRAKDVEHPRPESERKIGAAVDPQSLLQDLRENVGLDTALGLPAGPNSGLSVRLPDAQSRVLDVSRGPE